MLKGKEREKEIKDIWNRIENKCKENNLELLTTINEYKNARTILHFICKTHKDKGILKRKVNNFLYSEKGCKYCGYKISSDKNKECRGVNFNIVKKDFEERNYNLLETEYLNNKVNMQYICNFHPDIIQDITYSGLLQGQGCRICGNERISQSKRTTIKEWKNKFLAKNLTLVSDTYINAESKLEFICNKHPDIGIQITNYDNFYTANCVCKMCAKENRSGVNSHNYKGGITSLHKHLREHTKSWKYDCFNFYNKTCVITGERNKNNVVHHIYGFNLIVDEVLNELQYPIYEDITSYSYEELNNIINLFIDKQKEHPGVCLTKNIHNLFHKLYKTGNNTPEQFYEFQSKIESGEIKLDQVA